MIKKHMNNQTIPGKNSPPKILDSKQTVSNPAVPVSKHLTRKKNTQFEDERLYKTIFESASDAILVIDKNGEIINFNDRLAEIGGYKRAELSGKNIRSLTRIITADSLNIIVSNFFNRMAGLDVPPYEIEVLNKNGDVVNIEINARPLKKGKLTITTELLKGFIRISFADDGPGIPPDVINRIFDPFFTTKEVGKGTGLGLSICYGIVTKQGGRIYAKSPPGKGAIFIVELPVNARDTRKE